ncbi:DegQ family serine endoprotease [Thiomicrorhabdus indica]|uniref:DegQ family serine endoprotease n=1 Tax=Thiomicrorhabdus indica TaxID=2267253 RepID=UPI00102DFDF6|nr:DegQ family serine endoprotease [Thiomicrorhabdus indica]
MRQRISPSLIVALVMSLVMLGFTSQSFAKTNAYGLPDFTQLVEENNQAVVNISTTQKVKRQAMPQFHGIPDEMLRRFFGFPPGMFPQPQPRGDEQKEQAHSLGSGFIISEDGYILTNNHVIEDADEIIVRMRDRKELVAEVIGSDPRTDIALLKIEAEDLPTVKIGKSSDLKVGQWVIAIGEPFGLDYTVTHGIVSALGRSLPDDTYVPFIQTDVSINPGNSGGPLFNLDGEVVGINSQIYSKSGGSMGLSFSIPIDIAMNITQQLRENGEVNRGFLGVQVQEVTSELSESFGLEKPIGALIGEVYPDTPAEKAKLEAGDVILEFNGKSIIKSADLPPIVGVSPINKPLKIKILRQGKVLYKTVYLQSLEKSKQMASAKQKRLTANRLGAEVAEISKEEMEELEIKYGVRIIDVEKGPAKKAGIRKGDVLQTIDFKRVMNVSQLNKILKDLPENRSVPVRLLRNGQSVFLPLKLD